MPTTDFALYRIGETRVPTLEGMVDLYFDEKHEVTVSKTRQPLESGATLTDHAVRIPNKLTLQGITSDLIGSGRERAADTWARIRAMADARTQFDIITPIGVYTDMMLINADTTRNKSTGGGLLFKLEFEEVLIVALTTAGLTAENLDGEAEDRTGEVARGSVQAKATDE